jgi:hypothetical protein
MKILLIGLFSSQKIDHSLQIRCGWRAPDVLLAAMVDLESAGMQKLAF